MSDYPPAPAPLAHPVADNHCHLDMGPRRQSGSDGGAMGTREAIDAAAAVGVTRIVQVGCDVEGSRWAVAAAEEHPELVAAVAVHPNEAPLLGDGQLGDGLHSALDEIERLAASSSRVRAVGETGLDYFRTGEDGHAAQHESFRAHIEMAKRHDKTLMIHDRDAHDDILRILDECGVPERTVMHCFSGDAEFARACLERGAWLSFAGTVTFKNAQNLRDALAITPKNRILVETDAPFLTPSPHRGKPNSSYLIPVTVRFMADILGISAENLCQAIDENTNMAYGGSW